MNVDTLIVFEGTRGACGSLFETLTAIETFCPKSVIIFYDKDHILRNRTNYDQSDSTSLKTRIRRVCCEKKIKVDLMDMKADNYHFKNDLLKNSICKKILLFL